MTTRSNAAKAPAGRLDGTVALVTGASSGIGAATARALAAEGAAVALTARRKERLDALATELRTGGVRAIPLEADVSDEAQARAAVEQTVRELGRLDTVLNNAGVMYLGPAEGAPIQEWQSMVATNVMGVLNVTHAALEHLLRAAKDSPRGVADLVNVSSIAGRLAFSGAAVYNLTKFGVGAFSEALRQEVARRHVRVSLIEPGFVTTELASHVRADIRDEMMAPFSGIEPLTAEDIADSVVYIVTRPRRVAINEILVRPSEQER
jgi:NADP-dependent 3-hydroxy acid dehydrogenase YdfG